MNHRRTLAAAVACALAVGLCAGQVLADGTPDPSQIVEPPLIIAPAPSPSDTQTEVPGQSAESGADNTQIEADTAESSALASPSQRKPFIVEGEPVSPDIKDQQDPEGTVSFESLEPRIRKNNLTVRSLAKNIESVKAIDLAEMKNSLDQAIRMLKSQQRQLKQLVDGVGATMAGLEGMLDEQTLALFQATLVAYPQATIVSLQTQIDSCQDTLDKIKDGSMKDDLDATVSQLRNVQHQVVMGGETLYLTLLGLEQSQQGLTRNLNALDRTLAQLDVRYDMGQISALTLAEAKAGRTALSSGMATLETNITALRRQLEGMLGEEITGTLQLQPLTAVTGDQLAGVNRTEGLEQVKKHSYELEAATKTWYDAESAYSDLKGSNAPDYEVESAGYTADAAALSWEATQQSIELTFSTLCDQILDQQQVLDAARTALAVKQDAFAAAQVKYAQGTISHHALLDAQDALDEAADAVDTAAIELFTVYNNYCWAVEHGILN